MRVAPKRTDLVMLVGLLVTTGVLSSACGDSTARVQPVQTDGEIKEAPDASDTFVPSTGCCIMLPAGLTTQDVNRTGTFTVGVLLYAKQNGLPVPDQNIGWSILGDGDASLSAFETVTDETGYASVTFRAGNTLGTYTVGASYPDTAPVKFTITVLELPAGDLAVNVINSAASVMQMTPFDIKVFYSDDFSCRYFNPLNAPTGGIASAQALVDGDRVIFERLLSGYDYTVTGVAYGPNGQIVAKACVDGEQTVDATTRDVDLIFQIIPLNPVGTYAVRSYFDFGDAIAATGAIGEFIMNIFDGFDNPGQLVWDQIFNLCSQFAPGILCDGIDLVGGLTGLRDDIQNKITELVMSSKTGCSIIRAGCDLRSAVRTLEVLSNVYISKLGAEGHVHGTTAFTGLAFYWRFNCAITDPPDCGRFPLSSDVMLELQLVSGDWEGVVMGYDKLSILQHNLDLRYGKLIVYLINDVLLPAIAGGATNFTDALEYWFNCAGFANWLSGVSIFGQSLSYDASYGVCAGAINLVGGVVGFGEGLLSLQEFSSVMMMSGEVNLVDNDGDFLVDELVDGTWGGLLSFGTNSSPFHGVFSGCKLDGVDTCEYPPVNNISLFGTGTCRCDADCNCVE